MSDAKQNCVEESNESESATNTSKAASGSGDRDCWDESVTLSKLLEGVTESLNRLKEPSFSKKELESHGIVTSFQNLPCTFDISISKKTTREQQYTRIRSSPKRVFTRECSAKDGDNQDVSGKERCFTYIEVGIEHHTSSCWFGFWNSRIVQLILIAIVAVLAIWGTSWLIGSGAAQEKPEETSWLSVRQFNWPDLTQSVEIEANSKVEVK